MNIITWSEIEAECGDYRQGFVAVFRDYEGRDTDERDERGHTVKVTAASFARHVGIPHRTFQEWVRKSAGSAPPDTRGATRGLMSRAHNLPSEEKARLAAELLTDKEVAEAVVADDETRRVITDATDDHYDRKAVERRERTERIATADPVDRRIDNLQWVTRLAQVCDRFARDGDEALRNVGDLPESERYWLTGTVDRAEATAHAARRYLEAGRSDFATELETLLNGGDA